MKNITTRIRDAATCVLFGLALMAGASAQTAAEAPDVLMKRISQEVLDVAKTDKDIQAGNQQKVLALVESKIIPYVDFSYMTEIAVGRNWRVATPQQQQQLIEQEQ